MSTSSSTPTTQINSSTNVSSTLSSTTSTPSIATPPSSETPSTLTSAPGDSKASTTNSFPQITSINNITNSTTPQSDSGYSAGAVAGVGIGTAIFGAFLALLICLLCLRRRRGARQPRKSDEYLHLPLDQVSANTTSNTLIAALDRLDHDLPQASTHVELAREASQLEVTLGNYVDNFIDTSSNSPTMPLLNDDELSRLTGGLQTSWNQKLFSIHTRSVTLRIFLARFLAARVEATGDPDSTLLPPEIVQAYRAVINEQRKTRNAAPMQHIWRKMTAHLVSDMYPLGRARLTSSDHLYHIVEREARIIRDALAPFRYRRKDTEERENDVLQELVATAAAFGWRMFSERRATEFFWTQRDQTFPGVRQKSDQSGPVDGGLWVVIREPQNR